MQPETLVMLVVPTVVPAKLVVPQGSGVALEHKSFTGLGGATPNKVKVIVPCA